MKKIYTFILMMLFAVTVFAFDTKVDGIYYNLNKTDLTAEVTHGTISVFYYSGSVTIPETIESDGQKYTVTSVGDSAFWYCRLLTSVKMPNTVRRIGDCAMQGCAILKTVEMSNSVDSIGEYAFAGAERLTALTLPETLQKIKSYAFFRCESLTSLNIPDAVTEIGKYACSCLSAVTEITVGNGLQTLGSSAFSDNPKLQAIELPGSLKRIEYYTFEGDNALKDVILHEGLEYLGERVFSSSAIENITIPSTVTTMDFGVFRFVTTLKSITCLSPEPPVADDIFYKGADMGTLQLFVPAESVSSYQAASCWSDVANISPITPTNLTSVAMSNVQERTVFQLNPYIRILNRGGKNVKVLDWHKNW